MQSNLPNKIPCVFYVYSNGKNNAEIKEAKAIAESIGFEAVKLDYEFYTDDAKKRNIWRIVHMIFQMFQIAEEYPTHRTHFFTNDIKGIYGAVGTYGMEYLKSKVHIKDFEFLNDEYSKIQLINEPQQLDIEDLINRCDDNGNQYVK